MKETLHARIIAAQKAYSDFIEENYIEAQLKRGVDESTARLNIAQRSVEICCEFSVTQEQYKTYMFDRIFIKANGRKCDCEECKLRAKQMRAHLRLER